MSKIAKIFGWGLSLINWILPNPPKPNVEIVVPALKCKANTGSNLIELLEDATYRIGEFVHTLKKGFLWDSASIPWFGQPVVGTPYEPIFWAGSGLHDDMYRQCMDRKQADLYFYWILLESGVDQKTAEKMYYAVRIGGKRPYQKYLKAKEAGK